MTYYVLDGHEPRVEPDLLAWADWFEKIENRRVSRTEMLDGSWVSTIFLGVDHGCDDGPPLLFETCIFFHEDTEPSRWKRSGGRPIQASGVRRRYSTWAEAEIGHMEICESLTAALANWTKPDFPR